MVKMGVCVAAKRQLMLLPADDHFCNWTVLMDAAVVLDNCFY